MTAYDPATDPSIKERPVKNLLKCELTEQEKDRLASDMADMQADLERLEDEKKVVTKDYAGRIEQTQATIRKQANTYRQGWEVRVGTCTTKRLDTGEIVRTRNLTQDELQGELPLDTAA